KTRPASATAARAGVRERRPLRDVIQPQPVDLMQRLERAFGVPPIRRAGLELVQLVGVDVIHVIRPVLASARANAPRWRRRRADRGGPPRAESADARPPPRRRWRRVARQRKPARTADREAVGARRSTSPR